MKKLKWNFALLATLTLFFFTGCRDKHYEYYNSGKPREIVEVDKETGKPDGSYKEFYENGNLKVEGNFKEGKQHGSYKKYYSNGEIHIKGSYKDGKLDGVRKTYYENGELEEKEKYKMGKRDGSYKKYDKEGQLRIEASFVNDNLTDDYTEYYSNGKKRFVTSYNDSGALDGKYEEYYDDGNLKVKTSFKNDRLNGTYESYYPKGDAPTAEKQALFTFKDNKLNGATEIYMNGELFFKGEFKNGDFAHTESLKDSRDGHKYPTVTIGGVTWMAQNLNYKTKHSMCYNKKHENCEKYGQLYDNRDYKEACPTGWRLPTGDEFAELVSVLEELSGNLDIIPIPTLVPGEGIFGENSIYHDGGKYKSGHRPYMTYGENARKKLTAYFSKGNYYAQSDAMRSAAFNKRPSGKEGFADRSKYMNWDLFGFSAEPIPYADEGYEINFQKVGGSYFTSSSGESLKRNLFSVNGDLSSSEAVYQLNLGSPREYDNKLKRYNRGYYYPIRCVKGSDGNGVENSNVSDNAPEANVPAAAEEANSVKQDNPTENSLTDSRDGKKYKTVNVGGKVWMAENLNFKSADSWCYDNSEQNCNEYGRLYSWNAARKACPSGWRMASDSEWGSVAGNSTSFGIKTAGFRNAKGKFELLGKRADFWTADDAGDKGKYHYYSASAGSIDKNTYSKKGGMSVRCVQSKGIALRQRPIVRALRKRDVFQVSKEIQI